MFVPKMETIFLKLLFITILILPKVHLLSLEDMRNCSLISEQIPITQVLPKQFDVTLIILPQRKILSGITDITLHVREATTNISLHALDIEVDKACTMIMKYGARTRCREEDAAYKIWEVVYCGKHGIINLIFNTFIDPGYYILHIEHFSSLHKNEYKIIYPYTWTENEPEWIVTNMYSPNAIRRLFPSWDDPTVKVYIHMAVTHKKTQRVFCSVPVWYTSDIEDTRVSYSTEDHPISTHFITFMIVNDIIKNTNRSNLNNQWQELNATYLLDHAHTTTYYVTLQLDWIMNISMSSILKKIDHVILPICPMKAAGRPKLIVYREKDVTYSKEFDSPGRRIDVAKLVSYEMARQLFIGVVNPHLDLKDKWLEEMLASFYGFYILQQTWQHERLMELFVVQNLQTALDSDIYLELEPIMHKAKSDFGIDGLLYPLLYHKKAFALIRMLFHLFTPEKFNEAVKGYVNFRRDITDYWAMLGEKYLGGNNNTYTIKEIMDSWLTEVHHPEMHFYREYGSKAIVRYHTTCENTTRKVCKFKIPLTYTTTSDLQFYNITNVIWYEGNETKIITGLDSYHFFLANMEQIGYYRVNYDTENWLLLSAYLRESHKFATARPIPVLNRAQIVNDAFYFATIRKIEPDTFFDIIKFLNNETDYIAWYPMFNILSYMSTYFKCARNQSAKKKFTNMLDSVLRNIGYEERDSDEEMMMPLRLLAVKWACEFGHEGCRDAIGEKLTAYIHNKEPNIIPRWTTWMYCTGMMDVSRPVWDSIFHEAMQQKNMELFEHLTCTENENIILHYLKLILNDETEKGLYMGKICRSIIKKHVGKQKVLDYLMKHHPKIVYSFPNDLNYETLLSDIVMNLNSPLQLDEMEGFLKINFCYGYYKNDELCTKVKGWIDIRHNQIINLQYKFNPLIPSDSD